MGYQLKDLGTHSIWKGAATYCSGQPGGPPVAAIFYVLVGPWARSGMSISAGKLVAITLWVVCLLCLIS